MSAKVIAPLPWWLRVLSYIMPWALVEVLRNKAWRCAFGHDYWPYKPPTTHGIMSEAPCQCRRCGRTRVVQMWATNQLIDRWERPKSGA